MTFGEICGTLNFPLGLLIAEYLICMRLPKRKYFWLALVLGAVPSVTLSIVWKFIPVSGIAWMSFKFFAVFALTMIMPVAAFKTDLWSYLFAGISSYCIQHISYQSYSIIDVLSKHLMPIWAQIILLIFVSAAYYVALYFMLVRRCDGERYNLNNHMLLIIAGIVIVITVVISFLAVLYGASGRITLIVCLFSVLSCMLSLFLELSLLSLKKDEIELSVLKHMLYESQQQYEDSKESIDVINIKCHDLKHQISALKGKVAREELSRISDAIDIYDNSFKTGNAALDVVLTEKGLICKNKGIRFTCMLDGTTLSNMKQCDIYSLFGNALDNAINSVSNLEESCRSVSIRELKRNGFSIITVENYYTGELTFIDGLPLTTNSDKDYHGFGMKSMKMIVGGYGGELSATASDGIFKLQIILARH